MFVTRTEGAITSAYTWQQYADQEELAYDNAELIAFLNPNALEFPDLSSVEFKVGMLHLNVTPDQVDALIDAMQEPDRTIAKIYWSSSKFVRTDSLIDTVAEAFGHTSDEVDVVWKQMVEART